MAHIMHSELEKRKTKGMITLFSVETDVLVLVYYQSIFFKYADVFCETGSTTKHAKTHRFVSIE